MENIGNGKTEARVRENVRYYGAMGGEELSERIRHLEEEWDRDRMLMGMASGLGFFGLLAGLVGGKSWRVFTWMSLPILFLHALGKWVPPAEALARMGARSRREIEEEKYALKALRGDFQGIGARQERESAEAFSRATAALEAVKNN